MTKEHAPLNFLSFSKCASDLAAFQTFLSNCAHVNRVIGSPAVDAFRPINVLWWLFDKIFECQTINSKIARALLLFQKRIDFSINYFLIKKLITYFWTNDEFQTWILIIDDVIALLYKNYSFCDFSDFS